MTFFHIAMAWLKKVFGNTNWTHVALIAVTIAAPLVETIATLIGGTAVSNAVTQVIDTIKVDLGVVATTLTQIGTKPADAGTLSLLTNTLNSIKSNLQGLLTMADIKNADTKQKVTVAVTTIVGEVDAIIAAMPAPAAA